MENQNDLLFLNLHLYFHNNVIDYYIKMDFLNDNHDILNIIYL